MRTWLFAPAHEERKARKACASSADFAILDWEDAVPRAEKSAARRVALDLLAEARDSGTVNRLAIRVNPPSSDEFPEDAAALEGQEPAVLLVPKAETREDVVAVAELGRPLMLILESALGVQAAFDLARAHELVRYLAFGPLDLLADLGGTWTPESEETLYARSRVAIAARAARLAAAIDGPWPRLRDLEGLEHDTARARRMGYGGRLIIHPAQIEPVERAFAPTEEDLAFARKVLREAEAGVREGHGAISVDGRFVDPPVIKWAEKVLASASDD